MSTTIFNANRTGVAKLWLLNFVGNAALLAAVYGWLTLPDAHVWQVGSSAIAAILVVFFGLWLRTGTFAHFRVTTFRENSELRPAFCHALRNMIPLALWAIVLVAIGWCLFSLRTYSPQFGVWFWQKMPGFLRGLCSPRQLTHAANGILFVLLWVLLPGVGLPVGTTVAAAGLAPKRMVHSLRLVKRPLYWLWLCVFFLAGLYLPYRLITWLPFSDGLRGEAWSMGLRFALAYLIAVTALLGLVWFVGTETEKGDDPITVPLPAASPASGALGRPIQG
jgi:hypothetical protein